jgi:hypothetical protein
MYGTCNTHEGDEKWIQNFSRKNRKGTLGEGGRTVVKYVLEKWSMGCEPVTTSSGERTFVNTVINSQSVLKKRFLDLLNSSQFLKDERVPRSPSVSQSSS